MIPDEAIELALIANWDTEGDQKERMRAALEAAAPHIIQAWVDETAMLPQSRHRGPIYPLGYIEDKRR